MPMQHVVLLALLAATCVSTCGGSAVEAMPPIDLGFIVSTTPVASTLGNMYPINCNVADVLNLTLIVGSLLATSPQSVDLLYFLYEVDVDDTPSFISYAYPMRQTVGGITYSASPFYKLREGLVIVYYDAVFAMMIDLRPHTWVRDGNPHGFAMVPFGAVSVTGGTNFVITANDNSIAFVHQDSVLAVNRFSCAATPQFDRFTEIVTNWTCVNVNFTLLHRNTQLLNNTLDQLWYTPANDVRLTTLLPVPVNVVASIDIRSLGAGGFMLMMGGRGDAEAMQIIISSGDEIAVEYVNVGDRLEVAQFLEDMRDSSALLIVHGPESGCSTSTTSCDGAANVAVVQKWSMTPIPSKIWENTFPGLMSAQDPLSTLSHKLATRTFTLATYLCAAAGYTISNMNVATGQVLWTYKAWDPVHLLGFMQVQVGDSTQSLASFRSGAELLIINSMTGLRVDTNLVGEGYIQGFRLLFITRGDGRLAALSPNTVQFLNLSQVAPSFRGIAPRSPGYVFVANATHLQLFHFVEEDGVLCWNDTKAAIMIETSRDHTEVSVRGYSNYTHQCFVSTYVTSPQFTRNTTDCLPEGTGVYSFMRFDPFSNTSDTLTFPVQYQGSQRILSEGACATAKSFFSQKCELRHVPVSQHGPRYFLKHQDFLQTGSSIGGTGISKSLFDVGAWVDRLRLKLAEPFGLSKLVEGSIATASAAQSGRALNDIDSASTYCKHNTQRCFVEVFSTITQDVCRGVQFAFIQYWWCLASNGIALGIDDAHTFIRSRFATRIFSVCNIDDFITQLYSDTALTFYATHDQQYPVLALWSPELVECDSSDEAAPNSSALNRTCAIALIIFDGSEGNITTDTPLATPPYNLTARFTSCSIGFHGAHPSPFALTILGIFISSVLTLLTNISLESRRVRGVVVKIRKAFITAVFPVEFARSQLYKSGSRRAGRVRFDHDLQKYLERKTHLSRLEMVRCFEAICKFMDDVGRQEAEREFAAAGLAVNDESGSPDSDADVAAAKAAMINEFLLTEEEIEVLDNYYWTAFTRRGTRRPLVEDAHNLQRCAMVFRVVLEQHFDYFHDKEDTPTLRNFFFSFGAFRTDEDGVVAGKQRNHSGGYGAFSAPAPGQGSDQDEPKGSPNVKKGSNAPGNALHETLLIEEDQVRQKRSNSLWERVKKATVEIKRRKKRGTSTYRASAATANRSLYVSRAALTDNNTFVNDAGGDDYIELRNSVASRLSGGAIAAAAAGDGDRGNDDDDQRRPSTRITGGHADSAPFYLPSNPNDCSHVFYSPLTPLSNVDTSAEALDLMVLGITFEDAVVLDSVWMTNLLFSKSGYFIFVTMVSSLVFFVFVIIESLLSCDTCATRWDRYELIYYQMFDSGTIPNLLVASFLRGVVTKWDKVSILSFSITVIFLLPPIITHVIPGFVLFAPFFVVPVAIYAIAHRALRWIVDLPTLPAHFRRRLFEKHRIIRLLVLTEAREEEEAAAEKQSGRRVTLRAKLLRYGSRGLSRMFMIVLLTLMLGAAYAYAALYYRGELPWWQIPMQDYDDRRVDCSLESLVRKWTVTKTMTLGNLFIV